MYKYKLETILTADPLVDELKKEDLEKIGEKVVEDFEEDKRSRRDWEERNAEARKLAMQVWEKKSYPWPDASNVKFPLVSIASVQFASRAYPTLLTGNDIVKCRVVGEDPNGLKSHRATRVAKHMSWQLLEQDQSWEEEMDRGLHILPIWGNFFKKIYYDPRKGYNCSTVCSPHDLVLPYYGEFESCRKTLMHQMSAREIKELQNLGFYRDVELADPSDPIEDDIQLEEKEEKGFNLPENKDGFRLILEQHTYCDLDGDGYEEPYIVIVDHESRQVLDMSPRFEPEDVISDRQEEVEEVLDQFDEQLTVMDPSTAIIERDLIRNDIISILRDAKVLQIKGMNHFIKYSFLPSVDGSVYDTGFGSLLGPTNEAVNTLINQLIDSGTLQNSNSGFIGRGARIRGGELKFQPNEWKRVDVYGSDLKSNIVPLPVNQPSVVLFNLLNLLIGYGERLSSVTDMMVGQTPGQNTPATTSMNALEQGLKVFTGINKRVYRSLKREYQTLYRMNRLYVDPIEYFSVVDDGESAAVFAIDYYGDPADIAPSADPSASSEELRRMRAEFVAMRAASVPGYNPYKTERRLLEEMGVTQIEEIFPDPQGPNAMPPPPPPMELQIKAQEAQAKTMKAQAEVQVMMAKLEGEIAELNAKAIKLMADADKASASVELEAVKLSLERMKLIKDAMATVLEHSDKAEQREADKEIERERAKQKAQSSSKSSGD